MNVVCDLFDARDFRFETLPVAEGVELLWRFGSVSWSEPERPETVEVGVVNGETVSELALERDFWRALVRASASRARASGNHESANVGRKVQGSMLAKLSEDAILGS